MGTPFSDLVGAGVDCCDDDEEGDPSTMICSPSLIPSSLNSFEEDSGEIARGFGGNPNLRVWLRIGILVTVAISVCNSESVAVVGLRAAPMVDIPWEERRRSLCYGNNRVIVSTSSTTTGVVLRSGLRLL